MLDRAAAVVETVALALWIGALAGFAFAFAPIAFHTIADVHQFARLVAATVRALTLAGFACGGIAIACAVVRSFRSATPWLAKARVVLVAAALAFAAYDAYAIVPHMEGLKPRTAPYRALHASSSRSFGAALLLGTSALVLAALDGRFTRRRRPRHAD